MRHFNIDWQQFVSHLDLWRTLATSSQARLLSLKNNVQINRDAMGKSEVELLVERRLMSFNADRTRLRIVPDGRDFFKAMRAMDRHRFNADGGVRDLRAYASEHLTAEEQSGLFTDQSPARGGWYSTYHTGRTHPDRAMQEQWVRQWLDLRDAKKARQWESACMPRCPVGQQFEDGSPYFDDAAVFDAARRLMAAAINWPEPVSLIDLPERVRDVDPSHLWPAVMAAIRYLMLFPRMGPGATEHQPLIGLLPHISYLLHRPAPALPQPAEPTETFHVPLAVEDMTCLLVAASAEPLRVLANTQGFYQKDFDRVIDAMIATPPWLEGRTGGDGHCDEADERADRREDYHWRSRVDSALGQCLAMRLLDYRQDRRNRVTLEATEPGLQWLAQGITHRLDTVVAPWRDVERAGNRTSRRAHRRTIDDDDDGMEYGFGSEDAPMPWVPERVRWQMGEAVRKIDWRGAFADVLITVADGRFRPIRPLLDYHSRVNNPLLERRQQGTYGPVPRLSRYTMTIGDDPTDLHWENEWFRMLADMIECHLIPLGAVEMGFDGENQLIRLHDIGRYMLGMADTFKYQAQPDGSVIVQPNFEVVFMGPAPAAEAVVGRLAERTGHRMGAIFRITRRSILEAAAAGINANDAIADLGHITTKPLPDNVRREIAGWFNSTARVSLRKTCVIETPDEPTAARVFAAAGQQARQLTPTLVEVTIKNDNYTALAGKLKKAGVFIRSRL